MSEDIIPVTHEQDSALNALEFNKVLHGESRILDADKALYPSEEIGLAETLQDGTHSIVFGELTIPVDLKPDGSDIDVKVALVKFTHPDGATTYSLGGIDTDEDGKPRLNGSFINLHAGQEYRIGRQVNETDNAKAIAPGDLWPGRQYGQLTSREHTTLSVTEEGFKCADGTSLRGSENGTGLRGYEKQTEVARSEVDIITTPRNLLPKDLHIEDPTTAHIQEMTEAVVNMPEDDFTKIPIIDREPEPISENHKPPVEEALSEPLDIHKFFESGVNFETALNDPQIDAETRQSLNRLATAWKNLQIATVTTEVWDEAVRPHLKQFSDVLPQTVHTTEKIVDTAEGLAQTLDIAAMHLDNGDIEAFGRTFGQAGGLVQDFERLPLTDPTLGENLQHATNILDVETIEGDNRIKRISRLSQYGPLTGAECDKFVDEVGPKINDAGDIETLLQDMQGKIPENAGNWRERQQVIEEAILFARGVQYVQGSDETFKALLRVKNDFGVLRESLLRQQYDSYQIRDVAQRLRAASVALQPVVSMARRALQEISRPQ
jgi:hypothetical protein